MIPFRIPLRVLLFPVLAAGLLVTPARSATADEHGRCLTPDERRAKVAAHAVVPLAKAIRAVKARRPEVVHASLCERDGRLVYLLTVLGRDGKVARPAVDAATAALIVAR